MNSLTALVITAVLIFLYPFNVSVIHELGHAAAIVLFGHTIQSFVVNFPDGGRTTAQFNGIPDAFSYDVMQFAGGFAVALIFFAIGILVDKRFLLMMPFHIMDGWAEMASLDNDFRITILQLSWVVFMVLVALWIMRKKEVE